MKNFAKSKGKRITAVLLCAVMCIMSLPLSAFAFTAEEGKTVNAYYGDKYVSADGEMYYSPSTYQYIAYDANGNESLHTQSAGNSRTKLMIKDSSGSRQIMCIESGIPYNAGGTYDSKSGTNSSYFQNLPTTAQYGIMLTSVYGWRPGKTAPISGTNEDDFSMATQIILWEYQQQLRTSPTTLKANSYGVPADILIQHLRLLIITAYQRASVTFINAGHGTSHIRIMTITIQAGNQWLRLKPDSQNDEFTPSSAVWAGDCPVVRMVDLLLCNGGNLMAAFVPHIYDMSGSPDFWTVSLIERKVAAPLRIVKNPVDV